VWCKGKAEGSKGKGKKTSKLLFLVLGFQGTTKEVRYLEVKSKIIHPA
jgi:hypothetical protein